MLLTDDEVLAIAKREGQKLALGKNPYIDIDFARSIEAAVLKKLKQQEPVAFEYEIGTSVFSTGEYTNWIHQVTSLEPNTPLNAIRNLRPLYAAPMPADDVVKDAERYRWLANYLVGPETNHDDAIVSSNTKAEIDTIIDAARSVK